MSKLLYSATMSLDGYIAGPGGDMSWLSDLLVRSSPEVDDLIADIGALLVGHNTYTGDDPNAGTDETTSTSWGPMSPGSASTPGWSTRSSS